MAKIYCATFPTFINKLYNVFKKLAYPDIVPIFRKNDQSCWGACFPKTKDLIYPHLFPGSKHLNYWVEKKSTHKNSSEISLHEPTATMLLALNHIGYRIEDYCDDYLEPELEFKILYHQFILQDCKDFIIPIDDRLDMSIQRMANINYSPNVDLEDQLLMDDETKTGLSFPKYLNLIPNLHDKVIGREEELICLKAKMSKSNKIVLLNGLGGIGKTTLARGFLHSNKRRFRHIAWVSITTTNEQVGQENIENFASAFVNDPILSKDGLNRQFPEDSSVIDKFKIIMYDLQKLEGPNLLVIDNADHSINHFRSILPIPPSWHLLITSRSNLIDFDPLPIGALKKEKAIELFKEWHNTDSDQVKKLLETVGYHTLMIELLAKTLTASLGMLPIEDLIQKIASNNLNNESLQDKISTEHGEEEATILSHLLTTFQLAKLPAEEIFVLKCFYFLTPINYKVETLVEMFRPQNRFQFETALKALYKKGWLQFDGERFSVHRLIKLVTYYALAPNIEVAQPYIELLNHATSLYNDNPIQTKIVFVPPTAYLISQLSYYISESRELILLCLNLASIYNQMKQYKDAEPMINIALDFFNKRGLSTNLQDRNDLALSHFVKSSTEHYYGRIKSKWDHLKDGLKIWREVKGMSKEIYLKTYSNALTMQATFQLEKQQINDAEQTLLECLELSLSLYDINKARYLRQLLQVWENLAKMYFHIGKYSDAKIFADKVEEFARHVIDADELYKRELANILSVSGKINYKLFNDIEMAVPKFEEGIKIYSEFIQLPEDLYNYEFACSFWDYATILIEAKQLGFAEIQLKNAEILFEQLFNTDQKVYTFDYASVLSQLAHIVSLQEKDGMKYFNQSQDLLKELLLESQNPIQLIEAQQLFFFNKFHIGVLHMIAKDYESAISNFIDVKEFYKKHHEQKDYKLKLYNTLTELASCYQLVNNLKSAADNQADHYNLSLELFETSDIDDFKLVTSAKELVILFYKIEEKALSLEMVEKLFILIHCNTNIQTDDDFYISCKALLCDLFELNFEEWLNRKILPIINIQNRR